jgi:hypothetical protein
VEAAGAAIGGLAVEQQRQPFGVREIAGLLLRFELDEGELCGRLGDEADQAAW